MSKLICLWIEVTDDLKLKSIVIDHNDTELKSDSELIKNIATALLLAIKADPLDMKVQDMLNEVGGVSKHKNNPTP